MILLSENFFWLELIKIEIMITIQTYFKIDNNVILKLT